MPHPTDTVTRFYAAMQRGDYAAARQCLGEPFVFVGWFDRFDDPDAYIDAIKRLRGFVVKFDVRKVFVEGDDVCLIYDAHTIRGDVSPVAGWFRLRDGKIAEIHIITDSRPFVEVWAAAPIEPAEFTPEIDALLERAGLPVADLRDGGPVHLFALRPDGRVTGVVGIEAHGAVGLLRSLAVDEAHRKGGHGRELVAFAEAWAARNGIDALYLLTTTAGDFFARLGYAAIPRSEAPAAIAGTAQFAGLCPASSTFMRKALAVPAP